MAKHSGMPPHKPWEMHVKQELMKDTKKALGAEFNPRCGKYRMTTHVKVNETDH